MLAGDHLVGDLLRVARHHREHLGRQAGLVEQVGEEERRQWHLLARLEHHAVVRCHRWHDLVRYLVHRVVEGRDGADGAEQRAALGVDAALLAVRREVATEDLAVVLQAFAGAEHQHVGDAAGFVGRVFHAEARFGADQVGDFGRARAHAERRLVQDVGALEAGQPGLVACGKLEGTAHFLDAGFRHAADRLPRERVEDLDDAIAAAIGADLLAADAHGFTAELGRGGSLIRHD